MNEGEWCLSPFTFIIFKKAEPSKLIFMIFGTARLYGIHLLLA